MKMLDCNSKEKRQSALQYKTWEIYVIYITKARWCHFQEKQMTIQPLLNLLILCATWQIKFKILPRDVRRNGAVLFTNIYSKLLLSSFINTLKKTLKDPLQKYKCTKSDPNYANVEKKIKDLDKKAAKKNICTKIIPRSSVLFEASFLCNNGQHLPSIITTLEQVQKFRSYIL